MSNEAGQDTAGVPTEVTLTAAAPTIAATTDGATGAPEGGEQVQGEAKTFTQKEVDDIVSKRVSKAEAQTERRVLRTIERLAPQAQAQSQSQAGDGRPTRAQFDNEDKWLDARDAWRDQQRSNEAMGSKTEKLYAEASKLEGFDREAFNELPLTAPIVQALVDSDIAPQLMQHMLLHPEKVEEIGKLPAARQAAAIGKLEAQIEAAPKAKPSKVTAPIDSVGSGRTPIADLANSGMDEYIAQRKKQGATWAR